MRKNLFKVVNSPQVTRDIGTRIDPTGFVITDACQGHDSGGVLTFSSNTSDNEGTYLIPNNCQNDNTSFKKEEWICSTGNCYKLNELVKGNHDKTSLTLAEILINLVKNFNQI